MSQSKYTHKEMEKALEIFEALTERGIEITDWDNKEVEVEFDTGERRRWSKFWAASHLANELNKD